MAQAAAAQRRRIDPATERDIGAAAALGALLLLSGAIVFFAGRHLSFFFDEWNFILDRRGASLHVYLDPHNGHLVLFPVVVYKLLFAIVGLRHYWPYRAVVVALNLACGLLLYLLVRRRLGPWLALAPTALLLLLGSAYEDLLWPFQIGVLASVAGGLGALLFLERRDARGDVVAALLLVWSLTGAAVGIPFLVACAVVLVAQRGAWRRLWVVGVPAVLFGLWYLGWGASEHITSDAVLRSPQYVADAAAGAAAGIAGLTLTWGPPLAIAVLAAILITLWRRGGSPEPLLLGSAAGVLSFWLLAAVARADAAEPAASRYIYIGAAFIFLIASCTWPGTVRRTGWLAVGVVLLGGALAGNISALRAGERGYRRIDTSVRASLAVVELSAPVVAPAFMPEPVNAPQITAGRYLAAVRDLGSPAMTLAELERAPASIRAAGDSVLLGAEQLSVTPVAGPITGTRPLGTEASSGARVSARGLCARLTPVGTAATLDVAVRPGGAVLVHAGSGAPVAIYLRRLAGAFSGPSGFVAGTKIAVVRLPVDAAPALPWHVRIAAAHQADVCAR